MKKKVLSMLVTFAMLLSMFPATAFAADYNVTANGNDLDDAESQEYYKFDEVANTATADDKIIIKEDMTYTLTEDTTLSAPLVVDGHSFTLDLGGKTLTVDGDNKFSNDANVTIKNGTLSITGATASGDAIFCVGNYSTNATLTLEDVDVTGDGYSSAYAVFYIYGESTLNINGGSVIVSDDNSSAGGVFKAEDALNGKINIIGTVSDPVELTFDDAKIGFLDGTVVMDYVDLDITGGANAINQSALTVKNSSLTISGADGRALTLKDGDVTVENSTLDFSDCSEGEIRFKAGVSLTVDENSSIAACTTYADSADTGANINEEVVTGTEAEPDSVTVENGVTTIKATPKGTVTPAYTREADGYVRIWGEGGGNATESLKLKLFAGDTLIATTELNNIDGIIDGDVYVTWNFYYSNSDGSYWTTTWEEGHPNSIAQPTKVELYVDDEKVAENVAKMSAPDDLNPVVWRELGGVEQADLVETNGEYTINNLKELQIFRNTVNAGNTYQGKTVRLTADIDLNNEEWTPIGNSTNIFKGTFDGGNHTISNLVVNMAGKSNVGLFGMTTDGEVKNLNINNAIVTGRLNVGVVAGTPYTSKYTNIKVTGHVEVNGMSYVGGVGGNNAYADWTDIIVNVDDTSCVKAISTENGTAYRTYVGGVIGFMGEGGHTFRNITSNIDVIGDVCDVGGITGIAHYGNKFINVTCSGDVTTLVDNITDACESGGIAGVWHNGGSPVTFEELTFAGTLSAPNVEEEFSFPNSGLIGAPYSSTGTGTIVGDIAAVGSKTYSSLAEAILDAEEDQPVVVLRNHVDNEVENQIAIVKQQNVTIDLNGYSLNVEGFLNKGTLNIKNGTLVGSTKDYSTVESTGTLTLTDVDVTGARHAVRLEGGTAIIDGGEYKLSGTSGMTTHAINVSDGGEVTIKDGTFTGPKGTASDSGAAVNVQAGSTVNIEGGNFSGGKNNTLASKGTLTIQGGKFDQNPSAYIVPGYMASEIDESPYVYGVSAAVAKIGDKTYASLQEALKDLTSGDTLTLLQDVTIYEAWDCRYNGAKVTVPITIDGDGHTLKLTGSVDDKNWNTVFRFEDEATVKNLTIDASEATGIQRGISSKLSITVDNCTLIGNGTSAKRAIIFGEGAGDALTTVTATIINSKFEGWSYGVSDNQSGKDAKAVTITGNTFTGARVLVSASDSVTFTNNKMVDAYVNITSYSVENELNVTATGNDLDSKAENKIKADVIVAQDGFLTPNSVAEVNDVKYGSLDDAFSVAESGDTVEIIKEGTYALNTSGKDITITGSVDGVLFDNIGAKNMGGANVTFNNVTFDYYPNVNYTGLQHSGNLTYNNCTINGQVFLYGVSETFNNCTFNQNSSDAYNVWTYGAKTVAFNECTFNSVGKSVLVYNEGACATDLTVTDTDFIASAPVEGKAAIEIDTTLMPDGTDIVIDDKTTATGFGTGSVSGESLWNDKKNQTDLTVTVAGEQVWPRGTADLTYGGYVGTSGEVGTEGYRENIQVDLYNVYAAESLVVELWSGETKLSTTTLRKVDRDDETAIITRPVTGSITANIVVYGRLAGSWDTEWHVAPNSDDIPDTIKAYADGKLVDTWNGGFTNDSEEAEYIALTGVSKPVHVSGVTLSGTTSVKVGNTTTLTATVAPDNATNKNVTWTSSDTSVATVADGVVTGVAAGTATITVTTEDGGFAADCTVTVSRASSGGGGGGGSASYTIAVEDTKNGDITVSPSRASSGSTVTITVDPDSGYELDELTVLDRNGKEIKLTKKSDSKYTFKMPSGKVTIEAIFAEIEAFENPFVDVAEGAYYYDAVLWAAENGITGGTSATTFSPAVTCTRAQTVTFLWRAAGSPDPEGTNMPFTDVASDAYYYDAVLWAVENGITSGTSATTFSPNATVTRAQNVTFLWRWAESSAVEAVNPFTDVAADMYYHDAVLWAADEGITAGTSATTFSPDDPCLRSQIVTFLYRYLVK